MLNLEAEITNKKDELNLLIIQKDELEQLISTDVETIKKVYEHQISTFTNSLWRKNLFAYIIGVLSSLTAVFIINVVKRLSNRNNKK